MPLDPAAFIESDGPWATAAKFLWLLQLAFIVHVYRTGRPYWWIYVLFAAPAIGGLAYFFLELLPEWTSNRGGFWTPRSLRIRRLKAELEESDIVKTRLTLAEELLAAGEAEEASEIAEASLAGVFKDDPHTLVAVARFRLEANKAQEALDALSRANTNHDRMLELKATVLRGRALYELSRHEEAQIEMRTAQARYSGEEPRYFLALSLKATGRADEARELLEDIVKKFRRASRAWRRSERHWFRLAAGNLKAMKS
ncbi:MAG: hypothetical protein ABIZ49_07685 [Opitutaceae bacterium]